MHSLSKSSTIRFIKPIKSNLLFDMPSTDMKAAHLADKNQPVCFDIYINRVCRWGRGVHRVLVGKPE
jgi:hypothetical protein